MARKTKKEGKKPRGVAGVLLPTHMEVNGNREVVLEGCQGVLEYDTNVVCVKTAKLVVKFTGRNLMIRCLNPDSMVIEGFLTGIEYLC